MTNFTIKSLDPNHPEELPNFFDSLDYSHAPHWSGCYCRYYHTDVQLDDWINRDPKLNRDETIQAIQTGEMNGFLIYDKEKPVGWLNAQSIMSYKRLVADLEKFHDKKYALTICFVIHPDYRNMGLASHLLEYAIEYFKVNKFDGLIALPPSEVYDIQKTYRGTLSMYLKNGYQVIEVREGTSMVELKLNQ
jgi:GNAT superfamily N-acetyltransferase